MRRSPEERIFEPRPDRLGEAEDGLYRMIVPPNRDRAINPDEFDDLYDRGAIEADKRRVSELVAIFRGEEIEDRVLAAEKQRGELFEAIVNDCIENGNWLGSGAKIIVPSRFDDILNGVDSVVEFEERRGKQHLALAVDITKSEMGLLKKFADIKKSIDDGCLSRVKYFKSSDFRGELLSVPKVVIGADSKTMADVTDLLLRIKRMQKEIQQKRAAGEEPLQEIILRRNEARRKIEHHLLRFKILLEIKTQLESFRDYAAKVNKPDIKKSYEKVLAIIDRIMEKWETHEGWSDIENDEAAVENDEICREIITKAKHIGEKGGAPS